MIKEIKCKLIKLFIISGILLSINISAKAQDWDLEISLEKQNFMLHESIWLDVTLTNITSNSIKTDGIGVPNHSGFTIEIRDKTGNILEYTGPQWSMFTGYEKNLIESAEKQYISIDLLKSFGIIEGSSGYSVQKRYFPFLPVGSYTVQAHFDGVSSNVLSFDILEPSGEEKEALELMVDARSLWKRRDHAPSGRKYQEVIDKYPNSVYAETCLRKARVYTDNRIKKYFREGIEYDEIGIYKELLQKFPNSGSSRDWLFVITKDMDQTEKEKYIDEAIQNNPNTRVAKFAKQMLQGIPKKMEK